MKYFTSKQFITTLITLIVGIIIWQVFKKYITNHKIFAKNKKSIQLRFISSVFGFVLLAITIVTVLEINGIDVSSLIAGLGIVGIIVGFALQDYLKDIIAGFNIVWNALFNIGDVVKYGDHKGEVVYFSLRITKIIELDTGNNIVISNRNICDIEIISKNILIEIPTSYGLDATKARKIMSEIVEQAKKLENVENAEFLQTSQFAASAIMYKIKVVAPAKYRNQVERNTLALIQDIYKKHKIAVPFNQLDVHLKK